MFHSIPGPWKGIFFTLHILTFQYSSTPKHSSLTNLGGLPAGLFSALNLCFPGLYHGSGRFSEDMAESLLSGLSASHWHLLPESGAIYSGDGNGGRGESGFIRVSVCSGEGAGFLGLMTQGLTHCLPDLGSVSLPRCPQQALENTMFRLALQAQRQTWTCLYWDAPETPSCLGTRMEGRIVALSTMAQ